MSKVIGSGKASANGSLPRADRPVEAQKEESGGGTGGDMLAKDFLQLSTAVSYVIVQSTYIPRVPQCLSPRPNWDSPTPSPASDCASPRNQRGGVRGHTRLRVRGWGSPNSDDWRIGLALCLLCGLFLYFFVFVVVLLPHSLDIFIFFAGLAN